jgi:hypothetical protein
MPNDRTGHIDWGSWSFDYAVSDAEGLALLNGSYRGRRMIGKFSLPVIRVKYLRDDDHGGAGPYADQISWKLGGDHGLQKISNRGYQYVGIASSVINETEWLEISIYARIGAYHIAQQWHLSETGFVLPRVFSKGLMVNVDHTHHPYWRLDFDIDGTDSNRLWVRDEVAGSPQWRFFSKAATTLRNPNTNRMWFVRNEKTLNGAWLIPGPDDGHADEWSRIDAAVQRFHPEQEANPWPFGKGGLQLSPANEDVANADIVVWYIAHLFHRGAEGGDPWHAAGPTIKFEVDASARHPGPGFEIWAHTQKDQMGGELTVQGQGFTPGGMVELSFLHVPHRPTYTRLVHADAQGRFKFLDFVRCTSQNPDDAFVEVDIYGFDVMTGNLAKTTHNAAIWVCLPNP